MADRYIRPNPPQRKGVFLGGYINPELRTAVEAERDLTDHKNLSLTMAELLTEAIDARRDKRESVIKSRRRGSEE